MKRSTFVVVLWAAVVAIASNSMAQSTGKIYWIEKSSNDISRADLDGGNPEIFLKSDLGKPNELAIDASSGKVYWTETQMGEIRRSNLDGTNVEIVMTGLSDPNCIALDVAGGKMYWVTDVGDRIERAGMDGSDWENLITGLANPTGIALDVAGGKMYWGEFGSATIRRANLDGSGAENLVVNGLNDPQNIALDVAGGKMYWADRGTGKIQRANLDGTVAEDLLSGLPQPEGLALDVAGGKVYWTDLYDQDVKRANLDGSGTEVIVGLLFIPRDVALELIGGKLYVSDQAFEKILRANLDGSSQEDVVLGLSPGTIAADLTDNRFYWSDAHGYVHGTPITSTPVAETIVSGSGGVYGIVLDVGAGKIYWADVNAGKIQRSDLDGGNIEDVVTGWAPTHLALDAGTEKIYWADVGGAHRIARANLDGTSWEVLIEQSEWIEDIALDLPAGHIYWVGGAINDTIQRANLDGSNLQKVVVSGAGRPRGVAIETGDDKMYITDSNGKVFRSNLDGSNPEMLFDGVGTGGDIILALTTQTPTTLAWFDAAPVGGAIEIAWRMADTKEEAEFFLMRADGQDRLYRELGVDVATDGSTYKAIDGRVESGLVYRYRVDVADRDGRRTLFETEEVAAPALELSLDQNHPNPFNPSTSISFTLAEKNRVQLSIYSPDGRLVATLADGVMAAGYKQFDWDGTDAQGRPASSGVYFYRLTAGNKSLSRKMILIK